MAKRIGSTPLVLYSVRLDSETKDRLVQIAKKQQSVSANALARLAIERFLDLEEQGVKAETLAA